MLLLSLKKKGRSLSKFSLIIPFLSLSLLFSHFLSLSALKEIFDFYPELGKTLYFELSQNLSKNGHIVVYLIPNTTTTTDNTTNNNNPKNPSAQINWLWYLPSPPPSTNSFTSAPPSSSLPPLISQASSSFSLAFASLVRNTSSPFLNHIFDLSSPLSSLLSPSGRGGMVGDAAHPTSPHYLKGLFFLLSLKGKVHFLRID